MIYLITATGKNSSEKKSSEKDKLLLVGDFFSGIEQRQESPKSVPTSVHSSDPTEFKITQVVEININTYESMLFIGPILTKS